MTVNAGPEYFSAEKRYLMAQTLDEKIFYLQEMIRAAPKHKSSEKFVAELRTRLIKLKEKLEKRAKTGKGKKGIRKEGYQCALIGLTNSGKSALLAKLTNALPFISPYQYTTKSPEIGTMDYEGVRAQIVDLPSIGSEFFDKSIAHTADSLLIVIESLSDLGKINPYIARAVGKKIIVFNKADLLSREELRKLQETIKSKKLNAIITSTINNLGILELKEKIFHEMNVIRVYTKEPNKKKSEIPVVLPVGSTVKDVAESILHGFSAKIKETRLTGPSSKFPNQKVGIKHILKDKDIIEFHTK